MSGNNNRRGVMDIQQGRRLVGRIDEQAIARAVQQATAALEPLFAALNARLELLERRIVQLESSGPDRPDQPSLLTTGEGKVPGVGAPEEKE